MNLHEYQSKALFATFGIPVPASVVINRMDDIKQVYERLGGESWVVKAQVHAGGRGKGGGVKLVKGSQALEQAVADMLGTRLVTPQTGARGLPVDSVMVNAMTDIQHEYYLGLLVDTAAQCVVIMASAAGGVNIEEVARTTPEKILTEQIQPAAGLMPYQSRRIGFALGLNKDQVGQLHAILHGAYSLFCEYDASLVEINPLVITTQGRVMALDAKINFDDNALFRHGNIQEMRDIRQENASEARAREHDLSYVKLDGNIGCMVNGAGLAMATMDLIKLHGGEPANFLDVGGNATEARVTEAFKLILADSNVQAVLINIFGGIVRCDLIANGILHALQEVEVTVPVVVRLEGTNARQGREILEHSGMEIQAAESLRDAATRVTAAVC